MLKTFAESNRSKSLKKNFGIGPGWKVLKEVAGNSYGGTIGGHGSNNNQSRKHYSDILSWTRSGDTLILLFAFDQPHQVVPEEYYDLLPLPWPTIESRLERGELLELEGKTRGLNIGILAAPKLTQLEQLIRNSRLSRP